MFFYFTFIYIHPQSAELLKCQFPLFSFFFILQFI